jgi:small subunit ribosomal protein S6
MSDQKRIYEGLFLFPQSATGNLRGAVDHLSELFERAGADVLSLGKWDERRLAYEIKGNKRGVYFLAYLKLDPTSLVGLERDCNLSEQLLRAMVTRAEDIPTETIEAADGRAKLEDEIKVRGEEAAAAPAATVTATTAAPAETTAPAEATAAVETPAED